MKVEIKKGHFLLAMAVLISWFGVFLVYAYGTNSPSTFGHSISEVDGIICTSGQAVTRTSTGWECVSVSGGGDGSNGGDLTGIRIGPPGCNGVLTRSTTCLSSGIESCSGGGCSSAYLQCNGYGNGGRNVLNCNTVPLSDINNYIVTFRHSTAECLSLSISGEAAIGIDNKYNSQYCKLPKNGFSACPSGWTAYGGTVNDPNFSSLTYIGCY